MRSRTHKHAFANLLRVRSECNDDLDVDTANLVLVRPVDHRRRQQLRVREDYRREQFANLIPHSGRETLAAQANSFRAELVKRSSSRTDTPSAIDFIYVAYTFPALAGGAGRARRMNDTSNACCVQPLP